MPKVSGVSLSLFLPAITPFLAQASSSTWLLDDRHIASPLAMKERKIKINITIIYNIMLIKKTILKWHDDLTLTWNIKEIKLKLQQELTNNLSNHNS